MKRVVTGIFQSFHMLGQLHFHCVVHGGNETSSNYLYNSSVESIIHMLQDVRDNFVDSISPLRHKIDSVLN